MARIIRLIGVLGIVLVPVSFASAQEPPPPPWKGNLELSYVDAGGNSNSQTFLAAGKVEHLMEHAKLSGEFSALYGETGGVASGKNWAGRLKYDRYLTDRFYAYGSEAVERDVLKGIEIRYFTQVGVGYEVIKTSTDLLKGEVGGGYVRENPIALDPVSGQPLNDRGFPTARVAGEYDHTFNDKTSFVQTATFLQSLKESNDYLFNEETAFITNLMASLAFKVSYAIKYDNDPPPTFFKTDRLFKTSLLYTF